MFELLYLLTHELKDIEEVETLEQFSLSGTSKGLSSDMNNVILFCCTFSINSMIGDNKESIQDSIFPVK